MAFVNKNATRKKKKTIHKFDTSKSKTVSTETNEEDDYNIEDDYTAENEVTTKWYDELPKEKLPKVDVDSNTVNLLMSEAERVLEDETSAFRSCLLSSKKSDALWMLKVSKSGASSDKIAALALMVQQSPVHNLVSLGSLVNLARVSKKHEFVLVLETLSELFLNDLLHPTKKLKNFHKQPLAHLSTLSANDNSVRRRILCYWLFEDRLKSYYEQYLVLLNEAAHDSVQNNREKAVAAMLKLLLGNREQEMTLIANLVNKFGDPVHKVASRVVYGLEKVIHRFGKIKQKILNEVERMLFRANISQKAQYYGICFLSQFKLSGADRELAKHLITLYFSFFKACVKTGEIDSRLMGALLVGVNRAYPYAARGNKSGDVVPAEHIDTMYKVVHMSSFKISLQALTLLMQISNNDRFYNALYRKHLDKELTSTSHQAIWLHLVFKAVQNDTNENRKKSFVKRILQICQYFPAPLASGTLVMLAQLVRSIADVDLNFKFPDENETKASEQMDIESNLKNFDDDEDEKYFDIKSEGEEDVEDRQPATEPVKSSWYHRHLSGPKIDDNPALKKFKSPTCYDPLHRNPCYAGGEKAVYSELLALSRHFHPTVSLFAKKILNGEGNNYSGDPLRDFTLLRFLERFSFKNPKKAKLDRGEDKEELFRPVGSQRKHYIPKGMKALPVQSELYLGQSETAVPVDELFLYKYLKDKQMRGDTRKTKKPADDDESDVSDAESVGSVEFNEYLDALMSDKQQKSLDFADDIGKNKKSKKEVKDDEEDSESDDDADEQDNDEESADESDAVSENEDGEDAVDADEDADDGEISEFDDDELDGNEISESENEEFEKLPFREALKSRVSGLVAGWMPEEHVRVFEKRFAPSFTEKKIRIEFKITRDFANMAVPTEKFSEMLEEAGRKKTGGLHDLSNMDNAADKQLKWESKRMNNEHWKSSKGVKRKFDNNRKSKQRKNVKYRS